MCHEYHNTTWSRDVEEEDDEETPEFLNEEGVDDAEVLTDGGE